MKKLSFLFTFGISTILCSLGSAQIVELKFDGNDPALGAIEFYGTAEEREEGGQTGGYLSVTDAVNGQSGAIELPDLLEGGSYEGEVIIRADLRVGGGTDRPADGFSFNLVRPDDPLLGAGTGYAASPAGEANLPEEGSTTGLAIGFDEWQSGDADPDATEEDCGDFEAFDCIGLSVRVDGELIANAPFPTLNGAVDDLTSLQTGEDTATFIEDVEAGDTDLGWAPLEIVLSADNNLFVSYKGVVAVDQKIDYERGPGQFVFGGRTGGANANHHIDNLFVSVGGGGGVDGDLNGDGNVDVGDIDAIAAEIQAGTNGAAFDVSGDGVVDAGDIAAYVAGTLGTWIGDSNLDGEFNSSDFVVVFGIGKFETNQPATWAEGDWNGDGVFGSGDFVAAFTDGGFETGPRPLGAAVPEPSSIILVLMGLGAVAVSRRR